MLLKYLKERLELLESAADVFLASILKLEKRLLRIVIDITEDFETSDKRYKNTSKNKRKLF